MPGSAVTVPYLPTRTNFFTGCGRLETIVSYDTILQIELPFGQACSFFFFYFCACPRAEPSSLYVWLTNACFQAVRGPLRALSETRPVRFCASIAIWPSLALRLHKLYKYRLSTQHLMSKPIVASLRGFHDLTCSRRRSGRQ